jgi:hypothetical protein
MARTSLTCLIVIGASWGAHVLAAEDTELHLPHHHLAVIVGHAQEEQEDGHHESGTVLGLDYIYRFHEHWGVGAAFEVESFGNNHDRHGILAVPVSFFPSHHWRLFAAPGMEFSEPWEAEKAMFRLGVGYEFELGKRLTLSPEVQVDFVEGGSKVYVLALAFGFGF